VADSECVTTDYRCIGLNYGTGTSTFHGNYCMKRTSTSCTPPYGASPLSRVSVSGVAAENYCGIDETKTSCETILGLIADKQCPSNTDAECGTSGALCRTVNSLAPKRCTYGCVTSSECPSTKTCGTAPNDYCGGPP
jgi:hypothetical protein